MPWQGKRRGKGVLKVGYTAKSVKERIEEQYPTIRPGKLPYKIVLDEFAIRDDGTLFTDHDVHAMLDQMGAVRCRSEKGKKSEWYECTVDDIRAAILAVRRRKPNPERKLDTFKMRPEQQQAVRVTEDILRQISIRSAERLPIFSGTPKCVSERLLLPISWQRRWDGRKSLC